MADGWGAAGLSSVVVKAGAEFHGLIYLPRPARIEGAVRGVVIAERQLWIGQAACVEARVEADEIVVAGSLEGEVRARGRIEILAGARVRGTLDSPRLRVAEGALLEGPCRTGRPAGRAGAAQPRAASS